MAALLLMVAWRMSDAPHFVRMLRTAPRSDVFVLLTCFGFTVAIDMVFGVIAGLVLASLLFMRTMSELAGTRLVRTHHPDLGIQIPPNVLVYEIEGPLFFGAAQRAMTTLHSIGNHQGMVVLDLDGVTNMDATGLVNLQSVLSRLRGDRVPVVLTGLKPRIAQLLATVHIHEDGTHLFVRPTLRAGVEFAREFTAGGGGASAQSAPSPT
jgi:SulP family sulfate permease